MRPHCQDIAAVGTQAPLGTPVERFFPGFGGTLRPYFRITRFSRRMGFLMAGREMTKALLGDSNVPGKRT